MVLVIMCSKNFDAGAKGPESERDKFSVDKGKCQVCNQLESLCPKDVECIYIMLLYVIVKTKRGFLLFLEIR